jgi:hypothetical protein
MVNLEYGRQTKSGAFGNLIMTGSLAAALETIASSGAVPRKSL